MDLTEVKRIVEASLMAAGEPLTVERIVALFEASADDITETRAAVRDALKGLEHDCEERGYELQRVASGYRFQVRQELSPYISRLWAERPPRYSRALMETLALIAYRQPVTRGDIEQVRGVAVSQNIMRTLLERGWIREVGQREVPGRPSLYGTTRAFLDYFNVASLDQLPALPEIRALIESDPATDEPPVVEEPDLDAMIEAAEAAERGEEALLEVDEPEASAHTETESTESAQSAQQEVGPAEVGQEGARHEGARHEGARHEGARHDSADPEAAAPSIEVDLAQSEASQEADEQVGVADVVHLRVRD